MNNKIPQKPKVTAYAALLAVGLFLVALWAGRAPVLRIENEAVAAFIREATYLEAEKSTIEKYAPEGSSRQDKPASLAVSFPATNGEVRLRLCGEEGTCHPADIRTITSDGSSGQMLLTNLYPNTPYTYKVESNEGLLKQGRFFTTGQVRMLDIDGVFNVRDIGGWRTSFGKTVVYGKIIRGSELSGEHDFAITEKGVKALRDAGIGFELDLRQDDEVDLDGTGESPIVGTVLGEGVGYVRIPIVDYLKPWTEGENDSTAQKKERYYEALRCIFDCVRRDVPVYIHCWGGADRTGTLCMLIEGLLGVNESDLAKDYELTTFAQKFGWRSISTKGYKTMVATIKEEEGATFVEKFETFFLKLGFTEGEIEEFRVKMVA